MILCADVCRCHNGKCSQREACMRWLGRNTPGDNVVHSSNVNPDGGHCENQIPPWRQE